MHNAQKIGQNAQMVLVAIKLREVAEFQFFEDAYAKYVQGESVMKDIEKSVIAYLFYNEIPNWVRMYTQDTLKTHGVSIQKIHEELHSPLNIAMNFLQFSLWNWMTEVRQHFNISDAKLLA